MRINYLLDCLIDYLTGSLDKNWISPWGPDIEIGQIIWHIKAYKNIIEARLISLLQISTKITWFGCVWN